MSSRQIKKGDVVVNREGDYAHYYIAMEDSGDVSKRCKGNVHFH